MRVDLAWTEEVLAWSKNSSYHRLKNYFSQNGKGQTWGPWNSCKEQWPFESCNVCWAHKWRSNEEMRSSFSTLFALWKYIYSSLCLKRHSPILPLLKAVVTECAKWASNRAITERQEGSCVDWGWISPSWCEWERGWRRDKEEGSEVFPRKVWI